MMLVKAGAIVNYQDNQVRLLCLFSLRHAYRCLLEGVSLSPGCLAYCFVDFGKCWYVIVLMRVEFTVYQPQRAVMQNLPTACYTSCGMFYSMP
jgi:hypothetical protein